MLSPWLVSVHGVDVLSLSLSILSPFNSKGFTGMGNTLPVKCIRTPFHSMFFLCVFFTILYIVE
jgi:hypothetical protein